MDKYKVGVNNTNNLESNGLNMNNPTNVYNLNLVWWVHNHYMIAQGNKRQCGEGKLTPSKPSTLELKFWKFVRPFVLNILLVELIIKPSKTCFPMVYEAYYILILKLCM